MHFKSWPDQAVTNGFPRTRRVRQVNTKQVNTEYDFELIASRVQAAALLRQHRVEHRLGGRQHVLGNRLGTIAGIIGFVRCGTKV